MTPLCALADKYGTNKYVLGYTPFYNALLGTRRHSVKRVLEVGIGGPGLSGGPSMHAASLFMWEEYFPEAEIIGFDIRTDLLINQGRIRSYWADQGDKLSLFSAAQLAAGGGDFDLIIDDGVHEPPYQSNALWALLPFLAPGGVYVIEDVANCSPEYLISQLPGKFVGTWYQGTNDLAKMVVVQHAS